MVGIQAPECEEDLELIIDGDVVKVDKKELMVYFEGDFFGRKGSDGILHVMIDRKNISIRRGMLSFSKPYQTATYFDTERDRQNFWFYDRIILQKSGIDRV